MEFSGTPPNRGCTILLCGKSYSELKRVKEVMRRSLLLAYHSRLAAAYFADDNAALSETAMARFMNRGALQLQSAPDPTLSPNLSLRLSAEQCVAQPQPQEQLFRRALANTVLSLSPFVEVEPPYLETERAYSDVCNSARDYLPCGLYWSLQFAADETREALRRELLARCDEYARRRLLVVKSPLLLRPERSASASASGKENRAQPQPHTFLVQPLLSAADANATVSPSASATSNGRSGDHSLPVRLSRSRLALFRAHGSSVQYANAYRSPVLMCALAERDPALLAQHALPKFAPLFLSLVPADVQHTCI